MTGTSSHPVRLGGDRILFRSELKGPPQEIPILSTPPEPPTEILSELAILMPCSINLSNTFLQFPSVFCSYLPKKLIPYSQTDAKTTADLVPPISNPNTYIFFCLLIHFSVSHTKTPPEFSGSALTNPVSYKVLRNPNHCQSLFSFLLLYLINRKRRNTCIDIFRRNRTSIDCCNGRIHSFISHYIWILSHGTNQGTILNQLNHCI